MGTQQVRTEEVNVPMPDGTVLTADVVTLDDGARRPTLLMRTPYGRAASRAAEDPVGLARSGWSVVIQDVRGRFESEGSFVPFINERRDGNATVAWCAKQPWSDGNVVGWGASYLGATQWLAASSKPAGLKAIVPMVSSAYFDDGWTYEGGAMRIGFTLPWALLMAASDPVADARALARRARLAANPDALYRHPLGSNPVRKESSAFASWLAPDRARTWKNVNVAARFPKIDLPVFHVAGWFDLFCDSTIRCFAELSAKASTARARASQRLVIGPWTHAGLFADATAEQSFGPHAGPAADTRGEALRWAKRAASGFAVDRGVRLFVMGVNEWREYPSWPPRATSTDWYLGSGGSLGLAAPSDAGRDTFTYDPLDPVPTQGGRTLGPFLPPAGPADQRRVEERNDVLVYTSEPLSRPLTVIGMVRAVIRFATSGLSADVTVKLIDVHPDGRAMSVVDSVRRSAFTAGRPRDVVVDVGCTALTFKAGHRVRIEVSSSNFPRLDRNPSTAVPSGEATRLAGARQTVFVGGSRPSRLVLPVVR